MSDGDRLTSILHQEQVAEAARRPKRTLPAGTEPTVDMDSLTGRGTVAGNFPAGEPRDWSAVLEFLGFDPAQFEVDASQPVSVRAWDAPIMGGGVQRMQHAKATLRLRAATLDDGKLVADIRRRKPRKRAPTAPGRTDVICLSDWQIGKAHEAGGGTPETIERVVDMIGAAQDRHRDRKRLNRGASRLILPGMGDLIEACQGHYPSQQFVTDLNEREQRRVARWLTARVIRELAPLYAEVITFAVASNHGEKRVNGKAFTTPDDNADLELWENMAETFAVNPDAYGHVKFHESLDPLVAAIDVDGTGVAFTHAHKVRGGAKPVYGIWDWWNGQMAGRRPAGDCAVLVSAHYHHHFSLCQQGRTLLGCPALDGGSRWLTDVTGVWSHPGTLAFSLRAGIDAPQAVALL